MVLTGEFLFDTFLWGAFFVPLYLFACSYLLLCSTFRRKLLLILTFSILPFVTGTLLLKVVFGDWLYGSLLSDALVVLFGKAPSAILLALALVWELTFMWKLWEKRNLSRLESGPDRQGPSVPNPEELALRTSRNGFLLLEAPEEEGNEEEGQPVEQASMQPAVEVAETVLHEAASTLEKVPPDADDGQSNGGLEDEADLTVEDLTRDSALDGGLGGAEGTAQSTDEDGCQEDEDEIENPQRPAIYAVPISGILDEYENGEYWQIDTETRDSSDVLMRTLEEFSIKAEVTGIRKGPVITMFEILPAPGVKISRIVNLADNIALRLAASRVRIVAPIPGKHAVGIEVPNRQRAIVSFKEIIALPEFGNTRYEIPIALGKDIAGEAQLIDLVQTPHLLIAGATGSGKSVCVNSIICSIVYQKPPEEVRIVLIDPKIVELKLYNDIPHLLTPVVTEPRRAFQALQYCLYEMERRYSFLDSLGVRDIRSYNRKVDIEKTTVERLPYIVIVVDEFADLMATTGKEMEATLARLAAMSRAVGIHLVLATQRPSIDVITGLIKANIPSRIAFMVASKFDSRIIIDSVGAEKLLGRGDMLFSSSWDPVPVRIQGAYLSEGEVEAVTDHLKTLGSPEYIDDEIFIDDEETEAFEVDGDDPLLDEALDVIVAAGKASASYLQRKLKIGYNRAARMIEDMEARGIVGPPNGSKPRDIVHIPDRSSTY